MLEVVLPWTREHSDRGIILNVIAWFHLSVIFPEFAITNSGKIIHLL